MNTVSQQIEESKEIVRSGRRLRIVSDGTLHTTRVEDVETGQLLCGVKRVELRVDAESNEYLAVVYFINPVLEITTAAVEGDPA